MQTDAWLTDATHHDRCPLCSQPLAAGSNTCASCGFTAHEPTRGSSTPARPLAARQPGPVTPIPARASALRSQGAPGGASSHPASSQSASCSPASQQARGLRHDSPSYEAVSSLSSLSLIIAETPTAPPRTTARFQRSSGHLSHIDEIDTVPQQPDSHNAQVMTPDDPDARAVRFDGSEGADRALVPSRAFPPAALVSIDEIDTVPEAGTGASRALQPVAAQKPVVRVDAASWSVGARSSTSLAARLFSVHAPERSLRTRRFSPLDRIRWWLLRPGHIEFLLWLAGSVLLFGITFLFLLALVLDIMLPGVQTRGNFPSSNATGSSGVSTPAVTVEMRLELTGSATLASGTELRLLGQGFRPSSRVTFWLDGHRPLLDQQGRPATVQTDAAGRFVVNLWLGQGPDWSAGPHQILAREMDNGRQATVSISIAQTVVTPGSNNPGPRNTPVPPVRPTPTPLRPTPTPLPPDPTPGSPSPTASPSGTKVPGTPTGSPTSTSGKAVNSSSLSNDLRTGDGASLFARLLHLNPLVWLIGICYLLSLLLLGLAGVLHRRRR